MNCLRACDAGEAMIIDGKGCQTCTCGPIAYTCPALECPICPAGHKTVNLPHTGNCSKCKGCKAPTPCPKFDSTRCASCRNRMTQVFYKNYKGCTECGGCKTCAKLSCIDCKEGFTAVPWKMTSLAKCPGCPTCVPKVQVGPLVQSPPPVPVPVAAPAPVAAAPAPITSAQ